AKNKCQRKIPVWVFYFPTKVACRCPSFIRPESSQHRCKHALYQAGAIPWSFYESCGVCLQILNASAANRQPENNNDGNVDDHQNKYTTTEPFTALEAAV